MSKILPDYKHRATAPKVDLTAIWIVIALGVILTIATMTGAL